MAQSNTYSYTHTRNSIITRARRITGGVGEGETPTPDSITDAAVALNDLTKSLAATGMPLWALNEASFTPTASTSSYTIGTGSTIAQIAPLKIFQVWSRNTSTNTDTPMRLLTLQDYNLLGDKTAAGPPTNLLYIPPKGIAATNNQGTIKLYPTPDASFVASNDIYITYQKPFMNFDSSTDVPDFPQYWYNAIVWGLAAELAYEDGVGLSERAMISKRAESELDKALSFGTEEGSWFLQPQGE